jgi:glycerophosphoryl diester phosphodiesterase
LIELHGAHSRVLVAAAHTPLVVHFRKLSRGRVATSAGRREVASFWTRSRLGRAPRSVPYRALQVPMTYGPLSIVTRHFVTHAHQAGAQVHVWTVDCENTMRQLIALGVDGLMSDRPDRLISVVRGLPTVGPPPSPR